MHTKNSLEILKDLVRFNTQNPPGNEEPLVRYIHDYCEALHIQNDVYTYEGNRSNIIIRIGKSCADTLIVLGHLDVVHANAADWTVDPFSAEVQNGYLYGRGTLDMKYFIAASMVVMRTLKARESDLKRGITFVFTADEETGSGFGLKRLLMEEGIQEELSHKIVLNEGGGFSVFHDGTCRYLYETGQKSVCRIQVSIAEEANSNPYFPTMSHDKTLVDVLKRLQELKLDDEVPLTSLKLSEAFLQDGKKIDPALRKLVRTMSESMITPTIIHGGSRNPNLEKKTRATVDFDCRLLPGITKEQFMGKIASALQDLPVVFEVKSFSQGYEADIGKNIIKLLEDTLMKHDPEITALLPFITPGSNDGKYLKPLGCDILGFAPLHKIDTFTTILPLIHGVDERISLKSIAFCEHVLHDICVEYLTGDTYIG